MRIDTGSIQAGAIGRNAEPARGVAEGDVLRAQVVTVKGDQAQLRTPQGAIIRATVLSDAGMAEGENVTLTVVSSSQERIVMKIVPEDPARATGIDASAVLKAVGLPVTRRNLAILSEMAKTGAALEPQTILNAAAMLEAHPKMDAGTAVFLARHGLEGTPAQLAALAALARGGVRAGDAMSGIMRELARFLEGEPLSGLEQEGAPPSPPFAAAQARVVEAPQGSDRAGGWIAEAQSGEPLFSQVQGRDAPARAMAFPQPSREALAAFSRFLAIRHPETAEALPANLLGGALTVARAAAALPEAEGRNIIAAFAENLRLGGSPENRADLVSALNEAAGALRGPESLASAEAGTVVRNVLDYLEGLFARLDRQEAAQSVRSAAEGLRPGMETVRRSLLSAAVPVESAAVQRAEHVVDQARVTDSFQRFVYLQIPVALQHGNTTAELYVMKRSDRRRGIDPENSTLLVALDTQNIGRVESMIRVEGKAVSLRFRLATERLADGFIEHVAQLQGLLARDGFRLVDIRCQLLEEPVTPLTAEREWFEAFGSSPTRVEIMI